MHAVFEELSLDLRAHYTYVYLLTFEEERAVRGVREVAKALDRPLYTWSATEGLRGPRARKAEEGTETALGMLDQLAQIDGPGLVIAKDMHRHIEDDQVVRRMRDLRGSLAKAGWGLVMLSPSAVVPPELEKEIVLLHLPLPGLKEVAKLFHALLKGVKIEIDLDTFERFVKASLGLTAEEIKRVYTKVLLRSGTFGDEQLREVISEKRQIIHRSEFLEFFDLDLGIDDVGGLDQLKEWLIARQGSFTERARKYGLPQPKGLFLLGIQGCGKSLTAKAIADLWKVPLLRLDAGALVLAAGSAEEGMRRTIGIAESMAPCILWVDEIEKAFAGVAGGSEGSAAAARIFGGFITWLQEKSAAVFVVATANDVRNLPPEMLRKGRFDEIFWIDLPNIHERHTIFNIHLGKRGRTSEGFDTWKLAEKTEKFSGAEIEQAVIDAMFDAYADDGREFTTHDILRSVRRTVPLARTMDQTIKRLKEWARDRTRPATFDNKRIDFFRDWEAVPGVEDAEA
ncbi:MAG: AAA family ATPase [Proteobacteria bacterium]|nr:AAA family ATPase [Pseudomonadota bacterium]